MTKTIDVPFEFKGSVFSLPVFQLHTDNLQLVEQELTRRLGESQQFFLHAPLVIDLSTLCLQDGADDANEPELDFIRLMLVLRGAALMPVGVIHASKTMEAGAVAARLAVLHPMAQHGKNEKKETEHRAPPAKRVATKVVTHTVRAGQQVYAQGGDLVVMAAVNAGAEVAADGDVHVYGALRGRALAGARGDTGACIFSHSFAGEMLVIAGFYRAFEAASPDAQGAAMQAWLENEQLLLAPIDCFS
ncbi:MAG: septum site-determining protein MinC [Mariprofundaceae bacterium]|nr:septum site-determining protein MinC [Mariprofundaceae bacterium]